MTVVRARNEPDSESPDAARITRVLDVIISSALLVILSPCLLAVAVLLRLLNGAPILFRQTRSGRNERPFQILKFRTLSIGSDGVRRPSSFGRLLRRSSMDELPQLINILRGEMSVVGPRPLLPEYSDFYTKSERVRFLVRPGLTGLAQISGRNAISWDEKLALDVRFVENYSVGLYLRTFLATPAIVLAGRGRTDTWDAEQRLDAVRPRQTVAAQP